VERIEQMNQHYTIEIGKVKEPAEKSVLCGAAACPIVCTYYYVGENSAMALERCT